VLEGAGEVVVVEVDRHEPRMGGQLAHDLLEDPPLHALSVGVVDLEHA